MSYAFGTLSRVARGSCVAPHTRPHVLHPNAVNSVDKHGSYSFHRITSYQLANKAPFTPDLAVDPRRRHSVASLTTFVSAM
jgi:hypothetical protein